MHILIIPSELYVPKESPISGIFQQDQARALSRSGYKVGVISPCLRSLRLLKKNIYWYPKKFEYENDEGIFVLRYHGWSIPYQIFSFHLAYWVKTGLRLFRKYIEQNGMPDIVHAHNILNGGFLAAKIKKRYSIPYVLTEHSSLYSQKIFSRKLLPVVKEALENANRRVAVSSQFGCLLETKFGDIVRHWEFVPNVLSMTFERENSIKRIGRHDNSLFKFLNVAALIEGKGHEDLIKAFANHFGGKDNIQLRIGGAGPLYNELKTLSEDLGVSKQVVFLGYLNREEVLKEMLHSDVYILPSHYETFGVVVIEALACGLPVIATKCGGPESIVKKKNGILVPPKDVGALGEAMGEILENINQYNNNHIRNDCLSRYGEKAIVDRLTRIYSEVLSNQLDKEHKKQ